MTAYTNLSLKVNLQILRFAQNDNEATPVILSEAKDLLYTFRLRLVLDIRH